MSSAEKLYLQYLSATFAWHIHVAWNLTQGEFLQHSLFSNILLHCKGFTLSSPVRFRHIKVKIPARGQVRLMICGLPARFFYHLRSKTDMQIRTVVRPYFIKVLILCASTPAPKPLSIFITAMPGTQELSMAKRAVIPPRLVP